MSTDKAKTTALAVSPMDRMKGLMQQLKGEFSAALPPQIPTDKFIRTAITTLQMNPNLLSCSPKSVLATAMKAAQDGLLLDGREAAAVPFKGECQYLPMTAGILKKLRNSGEIESVSAHVVYANDKFAYVLGDDEKIEHVPLMDGDRGDLFAAYAIVRIKGGGTIREVMTKADIEKIRAVSKARGGPWFDWPEEMWRKSAIKRIAKRCPSSADLERVIESDNIAAGFGQRLTGEVVDQSPPAVAPQSSYLESIAEVEKEEAANVVEGTVVEPEEPPARGKEKGRN